MSGPPVPPPAPTTPLPSQAANGEMRLTSDGVVAWLNGQWIKADLFATIVDDPANFARVNVSESLETPLLQLTTGDAQEVVPAQLDPTVVGVGPTRQPGLNLFPPILTESDQSKLATALQMIGTSQDGTVTPAMWLWAKQIAHVYLGIVTDATNTLNTFQSFGDAHIAMYADGKGSPSPGHEIDGANGHKFVGAENHSGGSEIHQGIGYFNAGLARGLAGSKFGTNYAYAYLNTTQAQATGVWSTINWTTQIAQASDDGTMWLPGFGSFTATVTGLYVGYGTAFHAASTAGTARASRWVDSNGTVIGYSGIFPPWTGGGFPTPAFFMTWLLAGQSVQFQSFQNSGGNLNVGPDGGNPCRAAVALVL